MGNIAGNHLFNESTAVTRDRQSKHASGALVLLSYQEASFGVMIWVSDALTQRFTKQAFFRGRVCFGGIVEQSPGRLAFTLGDRSVIDLLYSSIDSEYVSMERSEVDVVCAGKR
jgi:hypothetical protein